MRLLLALLLFTSCTAAPIRTVSVIAPPPDWNSSYRDGSAHYRAQGHVDHGPVVWLDWEPHALAFDSAEYQLTHKGDLTITTSGSGTYWLGFPDYSTKPAHWDWQLNSSPTVAVPPESVVSGDLRLAILSLPDTGGVIVESIRSGPAPEPVPDSLYVDLSQTHANDGDVVTVTVCCRATASPLAILRYLPVILPADAEFVAGSLNAGAPGGTPDHPDGVWGGVECSGLLLPPDVMLTPDVVGDTQRLELAIVALGATAAATLADGALLNFQVKVHSDTRIGFITPLGYSSPEPPNYIGLDDEIRTWEFYGNDQSYYIDVN